MEKSTSMVWPTLGSRTAKEQEQDTSIHVGHLTWYSRETVAVAMLQTTVAAAAGDARSRSQT